MIPLSGLVFLQSNVSYPTDAAEFQMLSGTLAVGINDDPTVSDALVSVSMLYSDVSLKDRTSVCLMNISNSNGLYLYVPSNLSESDTLIFNITFLFPQTLSLHVSEFLTWLPHFTQWFTNLTPYVTFDKVTLGGPMSEVIVGSIQASSALVKSALAEIQGNFNVSESLILETVSAPIAANISLYNSGGYTEITYLSVSTGNAPLNASIALYLPPGSSHCAQSPNFLANVETFNAPLALALSHMPASMPAAVQLRAGTNLGEAVVSVDGKFSGTFNVQTTFADADVLEATVPDIDMAQFDISLYSSALRDTSQASPASSGSSPDVGKVVDFDVISSSQMSGWVGTGKRPPKPQNGPNGQGSVEVSSTLSSVALLLGP
ncbi:hypothetical protein AcV7_004531 [Taiwanofungus camphoratus]|nr:hypothetical protein AcV7_004531 [Antrodia cinnamomea]